MLHTLSSLPELWAARNLLQTLADRAQNPFLGIDWLMSAAEAFHSDDRLQVLVLAREGEAAAVAPLVSLQRNGHESLELIGTPVLMEPAGLLHESDDALGALVRDMMRLGPPVHLRSIAANGSTMRMLREQSDRHRLGVIITHDARASLAVTVNRPWTQYLKSLSIKMRQDVRRLLNRADAIGEPRFRMLSPSPDDVPAIINTFALLENSGWKCREQGTIFRTSSLRGFYTAFASRAAARGTFRVATLQIGPRLAAMQLSLEAYGRLWLLKIAYEDSFTRVSPGFLLMHEVVRFAHEHRLAGVEFLGEAAAWQRRWRPEETVYTSALAVPLTARGLSGLALDALSRSVRRWLPSTWGMRPAPAGSHP